MKALISEQQFLVRQPSYPAHTETTEYYYRLANMLAESAIGRKVLEGWPTEVICRAAAGLVGYLQDVLTDSGLWRSFVDTHMKLYGHWLPYYELSDEYVPYELNREDVKFMVWYCLSMNYEPRRILNPFDKQLVAVADLWFQMLDKIYDEAPTPEGFFIWRGLELNNAEEENEVVHFSHWLYMHCYLLTPAFAVTLGKILSEPGMREGADMARLQNALEDAMAEIPTGPLALYLREWVSLILDHKLPRSPELKSENVESPNYRRLVQATGGSEIIFIEGYDNLNKFFIDSLCWEKGEEHLPELKACRDFVLLGVKNKGMLIAHDICRCIKMPQNPYYDEEFARDNAIALLTVRGCCPIDLLKYLWEKDALPDAKFPGGNHSVVAENHDFIARCYLQQYYRGD